MAAARLIEELPVLPGQRDPVVAALHVPTASLAHGQPARWARGQVADRLGHRHRVLGRHHDGARLGQNLRRLAGDRADDGFPGGQVPAGDVDVIAVTARPGVSPAALAGSISKAINKDHAYTIATGAARGDVANLTAAVERSNGQSLAGAMIPPIILIAMFVLAATTALAVNLRTRRFALLRAVGASRGQVRRAVMAELVLCGLAGGALGYLPGQVAGVFGARALAAHQMLPTGSTAWFSPWLLLAACGISAGWFGVISNPPRSVPGS